MGSYKILPNFSKMTQPTLTLSILKDVGLWENGKKNQETSRTTPAYSTTILTSDEGGEDLKDRDFNYRQVIGKLLYLEKSTRPDIACAVHQCARYCNAPLTCTGCEENLQIPLRDKRQRTYL